MPRQGLPNPPGPLSRHSGPADVLQRKHSADDSKLTAPIDEGPIARYEGAIWSGFLSEVDDALEIADQTAV